MDTLILLAVIITAFLIVNVLSGKIYDIHFRFEAIKDELQKLRQEIEMLRQQPPVTRSEKIPPPPPIVAPPVTPPILVAKTSEEIQQEIINRQREFEKTVAENAPKVTAPVEEKTVAINSEKVKTPFQESTGSQPFIAPEPVYESVGPGFMERFMQNNPDLERFIGENLINKIGIAILVLGIGYFVKFAIDKDWINEIGRVFIGILAGGLLIGVAHYLRRKFTGFSSVLVGGGLAVLYFTIAIAFHEYQLFSQAAAFAIMVIITGFSVLLSVSYNRVELAVLAILGGFATPFMVSTGSGNYQVLFTYVLILNIGMLVLAYLKGWKIINWICYVFTVLLFGGWLSTRVLNTPDAPYLGALLFASLFYLVFFLMNIINNLKERTAFTSPEIGLLLSNTFFYYAAGMAVLQPLEQGMYQGLFTVAVAVFNFIFAFMLFRKQNADRNLVYLLIGIVITFISLAIPVQLEGNYITLFWALEAVLLLWFSQKSGIKLALLSSILVGGLMLMSLILDWKNIYGFQPIGTSLNILLNKGFITGLVAVMSLGAIRWLLQKEAEPVHFKLFSFEPLRYRKIVSFALCLVLYLVLLLELNYQLDLFVTLEPNKTIVIGVFNLAYILGLFGLAGFKKYFSLTLGVFLLGGFGVVLYALHYNLAVGRLLDLHWLGGTVGSHKEELFGFVFHYFGLALLGALLYNLYRNREILVTYWPKASKFLLWALSLVLVFVASSELLYHVLYFNLPDSPVLGQLPGVSATQINDSYYDLQRQTFKVGLPILWGICAFIFMFIGLRKKNKHLRIIALALFTLTLLKLFLFDIRGISEGGKIAAFIFLGLILLIISFMYQNIKKLILTDETGQNQEVKE